MNRRRTLRKRAQARTGCPGVAAFSPSCSSEQNRAAGRRSGCGRVIERSSDPRSWIGNRLRQMRHASLLRRLCCRAEAVIPPPRGDKGRRGIPRCDAAQVAGLGRNCYRWLSMVIDGCRRKLGRTPFLSWVEPPSLAECEPPSFRVPFCSVGAGACFASGCS